MSQAFDKIELNIVEFIPDQLEPGILYVSKVFGTSSHLCPCGCGNIVVLPITPPNWVLKTPDNKACLEPSIGNWELPCRSHYWIWMGEIIWDKDWNFIRITKNRLKDARKLQFHFEKKQAKWIWKDFMQKLKNFIKVKII